jgi:NADPH-dependent curcumin reductase CurA
MIEELKKVKFSKYFDNVGESQLDISLSLIQPKGIIAMCGTIDNYLNVNNF